MQRLIRFTALVIRFVNNVKKRKAASELSLREIQPHELDVARDHWHREVQREVIQDKGYEQTKKPLSLFFVEVAFRTHLYPIRERETLTELRSRYWIPKGYLT